MDTPTPGDRAAPHQFSLGHLTIIDVPPPELVDIAARCGYDFVSPRLICDGMPGADYSLVRHPELRQQTQAALARTGIPVHDIELVRIADGVDPADYEPDLAIGAELGARTVLSSIWTPDLAFGVDAFGRLCRLAARYDLTVGLEFVPIASITTMRQALDVLDQVAQPNARLTVDLHHFHRSREALDDLDGLPDGLVDFVQVCDAPAHIPGDPVEMTRIIREARCYLGDGGTDPASVLARLPQVPYSIEVPNAASVRALGAMGHAQRCLTTAREYLDASRQPTYAPDAYSVPSREGLR